MGKLIVLRRPGIIVVSGIVDNLYEDEVVLTNDKFSDNAALCPKLRLSFAPGTIKRMRLQKGAFMMASAADDFKIEMLLEGGCVPDSEICVKGFIPRFNGSFDFERHGRQKEAHVFSGNIVSSQRVEKEGRLWERITLGWKRNGKDEVRTIINWGKPISPERGQRVILVTGEKKVGQHGIEYYNATSCII